MRKFHILYNIPNWLISLCLSFSVLASCQGERGSNDRLSYDASISEEQRLELLKSQAKSFADSVGAVGYSVLGVFVNKEQHSVFYAEIGRKASEYYNRQTCLPTIRCKNIETGNEHSIQIPNKIDGHPIQANLIVNSYPTDDKILLLSTHRIIRQVDGYDDNFNEAPVDVFFLNVIDLSFHYLCGGCQWSLEENNGGEPPIPFLVCPDKNLVIPVSQLLDGSFRSDNMPLSEKEVDNGANTDEDEQIEDDGIAQSNSSNNSGGKH